jgi:hypothetical protein
MACAATAFTPDQFNIRTSDGEFIEFTGAFSEWELARLDNGRIVSGADEPIIKAMMDAAEEERNKELDRQIRIIGEALEAMSHCEDTKWYRRSDSWSRTLPGAEAEKEWPQHRVWAHFMLWPLNYREQGDEIEEVLAAAEEDFDYEQWINSKQYVKSVEDYNRHKLLATEKMYSQKWAGECTGDHAISREGCVFYNTFLLDRYTLVATIRTEFPNQWGNTGYAKASSDYGDIYVPSRFCGYIGQPGTQVIMTVALQDVGGDGRKANGFRWTCIYIH